MNDLERKLHGVKNAIRRAVDQGMKDVPIVWLEKMLEQGYGEMETDAELSRLRAQILDRERQLNQAYDKLTRRQRHYLKTHDEMKKKIEKLHIELYYKDA